MAWRLLLMLIVFAGCQAYRSKEGTHRFRITCDPVRCPPNCREAIGGPNGCPTCLCDPLCSPPKCPLGCEIEKEPKGPCPGCDCSSKDNKGGREFERIKCDPVQCGPNCQQLIRPNTACPVCVCNDAPPEPVCDPVKCGPNCREVRPPNGCPSCVCGPECLPPACPRRADCEIKTVPGEPCPVCRCSLPVCEPLECGANCFYARSPDKCPTCVCNPKCPLPICPLMVGCEVTIVPGETCPVCRCASQVRPLPGCDPVKCSPGCREVSSPNGCPFCDCKPLCSPPKCDEPGCEIKQLPGEPCPSCECRKGPSRPLPVCDPVKCGPNCREVRTPNGCPSCVCGPECLPPACPRRADCEIKTVPGEPCPVCRCSLPVRPLPGCDPVKCSPGCREVSSPNGCPFCDCKPLCSPPKCDEPGCEIKQLPGEPCPSCECRKGLETEWRPRKRI